MPPFQGVEKDDRVYGRGAIDNKGPAIAALFALRALNDNCVQLNKKVRLIFGTDEETSWADMRFYKEHEPLPDIAFSPDGQYPIINAEKGLIHVELIRKFAPGEKDDGAYRSCALIRVRVPTWCRIKRCASSARRFRSYKKASQRMPTRPAQRWNARTLASRACASRPPARARTVRGRTTASTRRGALLQYLNTLPLASGEPEQTIQTLAAKIGTDKHGEHLDLNITDETSGRLTCNLGTLSVTKEEVRVQIDIRYPISLQERFVKETLGKHFGEFDFEYKHTLPSHYVPEDSELITKLKEAYSEITGEDAYCFAIGGATYARAFDNAVTFGPLFPGKPSVEHGPDEYIEIDTLMKNAQIIANAIIKLCG